MKKPNFHAIKWGLWSIRFWILATFLTMLNLQNSILNSGFFKFQSPDVLYIYWFGMTSGTAGLLAGIVLGVTFSKLRQYFDNIAPAMIHPTPVPAPKPQQPYWDSESPHSETKANQN